MSDKKLCPLTFNIPSSDTETSRMCEEEQCTWWLPQWVPNECVLIKIARELADVAAQLKHISKEET